MSQYGRPKGVRGQPRSSGSERREREEDRSENGSKRPRYEVEARTENAVTPRDDLPSTSTSNEDYSTKKKKDQEKRDADGPRETRAQGRERRLDHVQIKPASAEKKGTGGKAVNLIANFYNIRVRHQEFILYNYKVEFDPPQEVTRVKYALIRDVAKNNGLGGHVFNGENLISPIGTVEERVFKSKKPGDNGVVKVTLKFVGQVDPSDIQYLTIYSLILRTCFRLVGLTQLGRHFYDSKLATSITQHRLQIWPGFTTAIRKYDGGIKLNLDVTHKVLRYDTCLEMITMANWNKEEIDKELIGTIVLTNYNQRTYKINDIDWKMTPCSTFKYKDGTETTFLDYYGKKYGDIRIRCMDQPLLVVKVSRKQKGQDGTILLVPELCYLTGLSEKQRNNNGLMRDVANFTSMNPKSRVECLDRFVQRLIQANEAKEHFEKWNMRLTGTMEDKVPGRMLDDPKLKMVDRNTRKPKEFTVVKSDWTNMFKGPMQMYSNAKLQKWAIIVPDQCRNNVNKFLSTLRIVSKGLDFTIDENPPVEVVRRGHEISGYVDAINTTMGKIPDCQLLLFILPTDKKEIYGAIKARCNLDYGVRSQCMQSKHLGKQEGTLKSIITKLTIQVNAKLGGEPWITERPPFNETFMVVGFDTHHSGKKSGGVSIGALVATTNSTLSQFFSTVFVLPAEEKYLSEHMGFEFKKCLLAYQRKNKCLPAKIFMYRDGVGEGSLQYVFKTEIKSIQECLSELYGTQNHPKLTFIVVHKKGNARIMVRRDGIIDNPLPGTLVDDYITIPERCDFFLVSQGARYGQTVRPTTYNVLKPGNTSVEDIQRLTYRFCHLYYNWTGTVSVPFVCQYAHKLSYLTGTAYTGSDARVTVNKNLAHTLYFL